MSTRINPGGGGGGTGGGGGASSGGASSGGGGSVSGYQSKTSPDPDPFDFYDEGEPGYEGVDDFFRRTTRGGGGGGGIEGFGTGINFGFISGGGAPQGAGGYNYPGNPTQNPQPQTVPATPPSYRPSPYYLSSERHVMFRDEEFLFKFKKKRPFIQPIGNRPPEIQREIKVPGGFGESVETSIARRDIFPRYSTSEEGFFAKLFKILLP